MSHEHGKPKIGGFVGHYVAEHYLSIGGICFEIDEVVHGDNNFGRRDRHAAAARPMRQWYRRIAVCGALQSSSTMLWKDLFSCPARQEAPTDPPLPPQLRFAIRPPALHPLSPRAAARFVGWPTPTPPARSGFVVTKKMRSQSKMNSELQRDRSSLLANPTRR
jgi:hypothetical protein